MAVQSKHRSPGTFMWWYYRYDSMRQKNADDRVSAWRRTWRASLEMRVHRLSLADASGSRPTCMVVDLGYRNTR
jgi:hypothetical protein